jgi:hypothetical protein
MDRALIVVLPLGMRGDPCVAEALAAANFAAQEADDIPLRVRQILTSRKARVRLTKDRSGRLKGAA